MGQLEVGYGYDNITKKFVTAENLNSQVSAARLTKGAISEQTETFTSSNTDSFLTQRGDFLYKISNNNNAGIDKIAVIIK